MNWLYELTQKGSNSIVAELEAGILPNEKQMFATFKRNFPMPKNSILDRGIHSVMPLESGEYKIEKDWALMKGYFIALKHFIDGEKINSFDVQLYENKVSRILRKDFDWKIEGISPVRVHNKITKEITDGYFFWKDEKLYRYISDVRGNSGHSSGIGKNKYFEMETQKTQEKIILEGKGKYPYAAQTSLDDFF